MLFINEFHPTTSDHNSWIWLEIPPIKQAKGQTSLDLLDRLIEHRFSITSSCTVRVGKNQAAMLGSIPILILSYISLFHLCTLLYDTCCAYYPLVYNVSVFSVWTLPLCILGCHLWCNLYLNVHINCFFLNICTNEFGVFFFGLQESKVIELCIEFDFSYKY